MAEWTLDELLQAIRKPLGDFPDALTVDRVHPAAAGDPGSLLCDLTVHDTDRATRWRLTVKDALDDLDDKTLETAALIVRANIEEWWHTRNSEPLVARMAEQLP
jgi:hypothetical protein